MEININTKEVSRFADTLSKIRKSLLPRAVMATLNDAAFDVKAKTMPFQAKTEFVNRQPNFFKANSSVQKASPGSIEGMQSKVGFTSEKLNINEKNYAVKDLEQQENGGKIKGKAFIPLDEARKGGKNTLVRPNARLSKIKNLVDANKVSGKTKGQKFLHAASIAGKGGFLFYDNILWRVDSGMVASSIKTKKLKLKVTPLYSHKTGRQVQVKRTQFMRTASLLSGNKLNGFFKIQAERLIYKLT